ncbi:TM2 domain-containing protein [Campylobacter corcagiensis]|uniref:TM2 domain-containing protein n=1 Tax=Campylobacter corcagiensis TaxID=1448857 RepID=A0A7M1LHK5_9BACT|nr:TM2 domain-containing protein [Campylobacter corcagiensis]QKF65356.1 putative membrane protein [Campylobacter corcagiensis]QOQ88067.1 TM2 domain-containing protein [Campylobacter corcagiensis]
MNSASIFLALEKKLPKDEILKQKLIDKLDTLSDEQRDRVFERIPFLKLKSPAVIFWVGSFLLGHFGVNRFMIGETLMGALKLGLYLISVVVDVFDSDEMSILYGILTIGVLIWWIADLFTTGPKVRKENLDKIFYVINEVKNTKGDKNVE